jgi:hypothetical protein
MALENRLDLVNTANRRGLLLGLTLSEIMMIILFALLLLFGAVFLEQEEDKKQIVDLKHAIAQSKVDSNAVPPLRDIMRQYGIPQQQIDNLLREMKIVESLQEEIRQLKDELTALAPLIDDNSIQRKKDLQAELLQKQADLAKAEKRLQDLNREMADLARDNKTLGEQKRYWQNKWAADIGNGKKGVTPCWAPDGVIEYIYDVALFDDGMVVRKNEGKKWAEEGDILDQYVGGIKLMQPVSQGDFMAQTRPLFDYSNSKEKDCRFFVRLFDETSVTAKLIYQQRRRAVEGHFFILDMKGGRFAR